MSDYFDVKKIVELSDPWEALDQVCTCPKVYISMENYVTNTIKSMEISRRTRAPFELHFPLELNDHQYRSVHFNAHNIGVYYMIMDEGIPEKLDLLEVQLDVGIPSMGYMPNEIYGRLSDVHIMAAAMLYGLEKIKASVSGEESFIDKLRFQ